MQFTIAREQLLKPLQQVCGVLSSRPTCRLSTIFC